jgi:hypothetical protein
MDGKRVRRAAHMEPDVPLAFFGLVDRLWPVAMGSDCPSNSPPQNAVGPGRILLMNRDHRLVFELYFRTPQPLCPK